MRLTVVLLLAALSAGACNRTPAMKEYEVIGQIQSLDPANLQVVVKHEDIKNFMPAMTMPYSVKDASLLDGKQPGDLVTATLLVGDTEAYLSTLTKTGTAPLTAPVEVSTTEGAVLQTGDVVPDQPLIDQDGQARTLSSLRGHRVALTFTYLKCPIPEFCPLMDRHFAEVQKTVKATPRLADVQLLSVSFDPANDTPQALKAHAQALGADPRVWSFVTGTDEEIATLTRRFGLYIERDGQDAFDIMHNLRTAIIDPEGRVVQVYSGNDWTPAQLVADLTAAPAPAN